MWVVNARKDHIDKVAWRHCCCCCHDQVGRLHMCACACGEGGGVQPHCIAAMWVFSRGGGSAAGESHWERTAS